MENLKDRKIEQFSIEDIVKGPVNVASLVFKKVFLVPVCCLSICFSQFIDNCVGYYCYFKIYYLKNINVCSWKERNARRSTHRIKMLKIIFIARKIISESIILSKESLKILQKFRYCLSHFLYYTFYTQTPVLRVYLNGWLHYIREKIFILEDMLKTVKSCSVTYSDSLTTNIYFPLICFSWFFQFTPKIFYNIFIQMSVLYTHNIAVDRERERERSVFFVSESKYVFWLFTQLFHNVFCIFNVISVIKSLYHQIL